MKTIALAEVKDHLSEYLNDAAREDIVITRHGRPAGVLIGFATEDDWFEYKLENDPRFNTFDGKIDNHEALFYILVDVFKSKTLEEWKPRLNAQTIPWAPVQNLPEVCHDPQARANDFFVAYDHPTYGKMEGVANPIHLSQTQAVQRMPCPEFSQHTEEILLENGYTWDDIIRFKDQGIIA